MDFGEERHEPSAWFQLRQNDWPPANAINWLVEFGPQVIGRVQQCMCGLKDVHDKFVDSPHSLARGAVWNQMQSWKMSGLGKGIKQTSTPSKIYDAKVENTVIGATNFSWKVRNSGWTHLVASYCCCLGTNEFNVKFISEVNKPFLSFWFFCYSRYHVASNSILIQDAECNECGCAYGRGLSRANLLGS